MRLKGYKDMLGPLNIIRDHVDECLANHTSINEGLISTQLSALTTDQSKIKFSVVHVDPKKSPFIMCTYPDPDELERVAHPLVEALNDEKNPDKFIERWATIRYWNIEADSRLFARGNALSLDNGSQFVAIICHELDHIRYTHPTHLVANYQLNKARFGIATKLLTKKSVFVKLFLPLFVCVEGLRVVVSKPVSQADEIRHDLHIPKEYAPYAIEYIDNHILNNPLAYNIVETNEEFDNEQKPAVLFTAQAIRLMRQRRNILKMQLQAQYRMTNTHYFKQVYQKVIRSVSGQDPDTGKMNQAKESHIVMALERELMGIDTQIEIMMESRTIDDRDIIILMTDADSISNTSDKAYVLNTAFDYIEILNKRKRKILNKTTEQDPKKLAALTRVEDQRIDQLNKIIKDVSAKKVSYYGNHYGLFVKYPTGYEG